jgi:TetR/AcrR family transcriptional repressor of bet genes
MPKVVDKNAKRQMVVSLTRELIRREGIQAVSMRDIAQAAGSSTAVISHYFASKGDLLLHIYRDNLQAARERRARIESADLKGLLLFCDEILPLSAESRENWAISLAFTAMATTDERFAEEFRENLRFARSQFCDRLDALVTTGVIPPLDVAWGARRLLAQLHGVATEATLDLLDWPPERQRAAMKAELAAITGCDF